MVDIKPIPAAGQRLGQWSGKIAALFVERGDVIERMPENFILVTLPYEDPEALAYSLAMVPEKPDAPVVYVLIRDKTATFLLPEGPLEVGLEAILAAD
jgi:hypothetical protein